VITGAGAFTGQMPFLSPNQQCQSTCSFLACTARSAQHHM